MEAHGRHRHRSRYTSHSKIWPFDDGGDAEEDAGLNNSNLPMFTWDAGGAWDGDRNDLEGEYGFAFEPEKDLKIVGLARHATGYLDHPGLQQEAWVTLWDAVTEQVLHTMTVGPYDYKDMGGKYYFKYFGNPLPLKAHRQYRITQTCHKGMKDVWFDDVAKEPDIELYGMTECVKIKNGVHSTTPRAFPDKIEEDLRRAGMLNFRMDVGDGCGYYDDEEYED
jgi:hypothetical protein